MSVEMFQRRPGDSFPEIGFTSLAGGPSSLIVSSGIPDFAKAPPGLVPLGIKEGDRLDVVAIHSCRPRQECPECHALGIEKLWRLRAKNGRMISCFECVHPDHRAFVWARTQADTEEEKTGGA